LDSENRRVNAHLVLFEFPKQCPDAKACIGNK
jgi:hypothetical protein